MVKFNVTAAETALIDQIAERAVKEVFPHHPHQDFTAVHMDLCATIAQGCPLDLEKLLAFDAFNFMHDVGGIYRHIDRSSGFLQNCFLPRCACSLKEK